MNVAELEWKKLGPEYDVLLARKIEGKVAKFSINDICWRSTV
jgi:hypothetical protein